MLALCLMLSVTYFVQNYAGIIGWSLHRALQNIYAPTNITQECESLQHDLTVQLLVGSLAASSESR